MKEIFDFLKEAGTYYLATTQGDQPRVRPFGSAAIFENRLYILTSKSKDVSHQLAVNPKVEISATLGMKWIRLSGKLVNDDRVEAKQYVLDQHPELKTMYSAEDSNTQVLYLSDAVATFYSFEEAPKTVKF